MGRGRRLRSLIAGGPSRAKKRDDSLSCSDEAETCTKQAHKRKERPLPDKLCVQTKDGIRLSKLPPTVPQKTLATLPKVLQVNQNLERTLKRLRAQLMEREETNVRNEAQARMEDSDQKLFDLVPPIYHCSRLKLEEADRVLRQACMGRYIAILREARGRLLRTEYLGNLEIVQHAKKEVKKESQGDQRDAEDAEDLSEHMKILAENLGTKLAESLVHIHKDQTADQNLYTHPFRMACWLAGLGHSLFDATKGVREGILELQRLIVNREINTMAEFGRLLSVHGLDPPAHHFRSPLFSRPRKAEDSKKEEEEKELVRSPPPNVNTNVTNTELQRMSHRQFEFYTFLNQVDRCLAFCRNLKMKRERDALFFVMSKVAEFRKLSHAGIFTLQKELLKDISQMTEEVWLKQVNILDLRVHIKLLEEVKLRICHLGGTIKRIPLMDNKVFDCYVAVLMCNTKIGVKLLEYHQEDGNNPYTDPFVMATWLAAMGYFGEGLEIRNEEAHQLAQAIREGSFNPMPDFNRLLKANDLPWPTHNFPIVWFPRQGEMTMTKERPARLC